jgi:predicted TPR repeat methyltransferase
MDCSNNLLELAKDKNSYYQLERRVFGQKDTVITDEMKEKYDFVSAASILNNDGYDIKIFKNMVECCKTNGFIVFATKLDFH